MLPVEAVVRFMVTVQADGMRVNDLAAWAFGEKDAWAQHVMGSVLWQIQERHLQAVLDGGAELACTGCGVVGSGRGAFLRRGSRARTIRTSSGGVRFRLLQLTCRECRKTWSPFAEHLGLRARQRIAEELTRRLVDWVTELSYAKTCRLAGEWLGDTSSPKTLHAHVQARGSEVTFTEAAPLSVLVEDGTKVPAGPKPRGEDLVVAFQIQGRCEVLGRPVVQKRVVGMGLGYGCWEEALATAGEPDLVVTDGELSVRRLVAGYFPEARHQLCEWRVPYTMAHTLGLEGMAVEERTELAKALSGLLARRDPKALAFADRLDGYPKTQAFLRNAAPYILDPTPAQERTTSVMEREMREVNRRADVGVRWSLRGIANLMRLRLAKRHNQDDYERLWRPLRPGRSALVPQA